MSAVEVSFIAAIGINDLAVIVASDDQFVKEDVQYNSNHLQDLGIDGWQVLDPGLYRWTGTAYVSYTEPAYYGNFELLYSFEATQTDKQSPPDQTQDPA